MSLYAWTPHQIDVARNIVAIARKYDFPPLLMLTVTLQESGWDDGAVGDSGQSFGPFQLYVQAHPCGQCLGPNPWYDYGYPEMRERWDRTLDELGGAAAWQASTDRGAFAAEFAPLAQGSIAWSLELGRERYAQALDMWELVG